MEIVFFWVAVSIAVGVYASGKARSGFGWFCISLFISPLLSAIFLAVLPSLKTTIDVNAPTPDTHVRCPDCRELVRFDAVKCRYCSCALIPQKI